MRNFRKGAKSFIALVMTLAMLLGICLPAGAMGISADDTVTDELAYSVTYENGKIVVKINPETVYRILKDKEISKDELKMLIPEEILDAAAKGRELTLDDLKELAANYVTLDEIKDMVNDIPRDIVAEYLDIDFLKSLISTEDLINILPIDEIIEVATGDALNILLTDEVVDLLFKELIHKDEFMDKIADEDFVNGLLEDDALIDFVTTDPGVKDRILDMVDANLAETLLDDPVVGPKFEEYVADLIFNDDDILKSIFDYVLDYESDPSKQTADDVLKQDRLTSFITNEIVEKKFLTMDNLLNKDVMDDLIAAKVLDESIVTAVFTAEELKQIITDEMLSDVLSDAAFVKNVVDGSTIADTVLTDKLIKDLASNAVIKAKIEGIAKNLFTYEEIRGLNIVDEDKVVDAFVAAGNFDAAAMKASGIYSIDGAALDVSYLVAAVGDPIKVYDTAIAAGVDPYDGLDENELVKILQPLYESGALTFRSFVDMEGITINADKVADVLLANGSAPSDFIADGVDYVDTIFANDAATTKIVNAVKADDSAIDVIVSEGKAEIKTQVEDLIDANVISVNDILDLMDDNTVAGIIAKIDPQSVVDVINASGNAQAKFDALLDTIDDMSTMVSAISQETMNSVFEDNKAIFKDSAVIDLFIEIFDPFGDNGILDHIPGLDTIIAEKADFAYLLKDVIGVSNLTKFFAVEDIIDAVGINTILDFVGIDKVIDQLGGPQEMFSLFSQDEIKQIFDAIGTDNIKKFITEGGILDVIDVREIAYNVIDYVKERVPLVKDFIKETVKRTFTILVTRVDSIKYAGVEIFSNGQFDANAMIAVLFDQLPDIETFLSIEEDGTLFNAVLSFDIIYESDDENQPDEIKTFNYGFEVKFEGDPTNLQKVVDSTEFRYFLGAIPEGYYFATLQLPEVVSDLYARVLASSRVPQTVKDLLVILPGLNADELKTAITDVLSNEEIFYTVHDALDEIKAKAYGKIDQKFEDVAVIEKAKAKIDQILDNFVSLDKYNALTGKIIAGVEKITAKVGEDWSIFDYYYGEGEFYADGAYSFDFIDALNRFISIPDEVAVLFKSTVLSFNMMAQITVDGLYSVTAVDQNGNAFTTILPDGTDLSLLSGVLGCNGFLDADAEPLEVMPDEDVVVYTDDSYYVQFLIDGNVVATEFYPIGADSVEEPDLETLDWEGKDTTKYVYEWESYELNVQQVTKVNLVTSNNAVVVTFVDKEGTFLGTHAFPYGTPEEDVLRFAKDNFGKEGYTLSISGYEEDGAREQTVTVEYIGEVYSIIWFTDSDMQTIWKVTRWTFGDPSTYPTSNPSAPTKEGYTFKEWNIDISEIDFTVPANCTIYAVWEKNAGPDTPPDTPDKEMVTVTFVEEGTSVLLGVMEFEYGTSADVVAKYATDTFIRAGYTLAIEGYTADGAKQQTVTVKYSTITYTATFIADGIVVGTVPFTVESTVPLEGAPAVPEKEGFKGEWKEYEIKAEDMEIIAIYTAIEGEDGGAGWILWLILAIVLLIVIALVIFFITRGRSSTPPAAPTVAPVVDVEPEPEPEVEAEEAVAEVEPEPEIEPEEVPVAVVEEEVEIVEDVTVEEADELMTDDTAMHLFATKTVVVEEGAKAIVNISTINDAFEAGDVVTLEALKEKRLVPSKTVKVKILAGGHLNKALTVEANSFSVQAIKMIKLTGGEVTVLVTE